MKKQIILFLLLLTGFITHAQKYQPALLHGKEENRIDIATLLGIPNDTFSIPSTPADKTTKPHIAAKGMVIYLYDTLLKKWSAYESGGGLTRLGGPGTWLTRPTDSTYAVDTAAANAYYKTLFVQLGLTYTNPSWLASITQSKVTGLADSLNKKAYKDSLVSIVITFDVFLYIRINIPVVTLLKPVAVTVPPTIAYNCDGLLLSQ